MNNFKRIVAVVLAGVLLLSAASCGKKNKSLDLNKFPMVYADDGGLKMLADGEKEPTLLTKKFYTVFNSQNKVQVATNGKIYYVETKDSKTILGDLYEYDIAKKEAILLHKNVFNYKVNSDGSSIVISDGTGAILLYNKKHEKKNDYKYIQSERVSNILSISADGKYVLYAQTLSGKTVPSLTLARTDFEADESVSKRSEKEVFANKDITKAPIVLAESYKEYVGSNSDLSAIYFVTGKRTEKNDDSVLAMCKNYKSVVNIYKGNASTYFVDESGKLMYSCAETKAKKISDIVTDKNAASDKKITKKNSNAKLYNQKVTRDNIREKIQTYLDNITTTTFYQMSKSLDKPEKIAEISGQLIEQGTDKENYLAFFGTTKYDFESAKKTDINKVSVAYKLFDDIKSRQFIAVGIKGVVNFDAGKDIEYNSADCFVDTVNNKVNIMMNFDYLDKKIGTLYTANYTSDGFEKPTKVSAGAKAVAHFNSKDEIYFVNSDSSLVKNNEKTVVLKNYASSSLTPEVPVVYTSTDTGKKDKYGLAITNNTAYLINEKGATSLGKIYADKQIVPKASSFAYFTDFDISANKGSAKLYNGSEIVDLGKSVSVIYNFSK